MLGKGFPGADLRGAALIAQQPSGSQCRTGSGRVLEKRPAIHGCSHLQSYPQAIYGAVLSRPASTRAMKASSSSKVLKWAA